jgi:hypothetical protein
VLALASSPGVHAALAPPTPPRLPPLGDVRTALAPITHAEPVDPLGAATKLVEAAGLVLALRLSHTPVGSARALPKRREGAGP